MGAPPRAAGRTLTQGKGSIKAAVGRVSVLTPVIPEIRRIMVLGLGATLEASLGTQFARLYHRKEHHRKGLLE
jgi:hypothetical protein